MSVLSRIKRFLEIEPSRRGRRTRKGKTERQSKRRRRGENGRFKKR